MANLAQSTLAQRPAAAGLDLTQELIVRLPYGDISEYQGTRAALEAEGVIPVGTLWPAGFADTRWETATHRCWLRRERPDGIKGPRKDFMDIDWWMFRCVPHCAKPAAARVVGHKAKELAAVIYRQSAQGMAVFHAEWRAWLAARDDAAYQAFKARIPGIHRPRLGRPAKGATPEFFSQKEAKHV